MPIAVLFCSSILWGLTWLPLKYLHAQGVEILILLTVSCGVVGLLGLPVLWSQRAECRRYPGVLLLVLALGGFASLAFNCALMYGDVVRVMVLFYLVPLWSAVGGRLVLGELIDRQRLASVALALGGVWLILGGWKILDEALVWQDWLALASGFAFAMNNLVFRATPAVPLASKIVMMFWGCSLLGLALLLAGIESVPTLAPLNWLWILLMGLVWYMAATVGSQWAVTRLQAGQAGVIMVMELIAAVLSAVLLGESVLTPLNAAGVGCVLVASVLEAWRSADDGHQRAAQ